MIKDPRLYESLTDTVENLNLTLKKFSEQLEIWKKHGILHKEK